MNPNERQVGGTHYQRTGAVQHWDVMAALQADYFTGVITKYLGRYEWKNGVEDIDKSRHYLEKINYVEGVIWSWLRRNWCRFMLWRHRGLVDQWLQGICNQSQACDNVKTLRERAILATLRGDYWRAAEYTIYLRHYLARPPADE